MNKGDRGVRCGCPRRCLKPSVCTQTQLTLGSHTQPAVLSDAVNGESPMEAGAEADRLDSIILH